MGSNPGITYRPCHSLGTPAVSGAHAVLQEAHTPQLIARQLFPSHPPLSDRAPCNSLLPYLSWPPTSYFPPGWKMGRRARRWESIQTQLGHPGNKENKTLKHPTPNRGASKADFLKRIFLLLLKQLFSSAKNKVGSLGLKWPMLRILRSPFTSTNLLPAKPTLHPSSKLHTPLRRGPGVGAKKINSNPKALLECKVQADKESFKTGTYIAAVATSHPSAFLKRKKGGANAYIGGNI